MEKVLFDAKSVEIYRQNLFVIYLQADSIILMIFDKKS